MILPTLFGTLFATGVVAIGTLAGASVVRGGTAPMSSPAAVIGAPVAARTVLEKAKRPTQRQMPRYLVAATELWTSTHDARRVRELLQGALEDLAADDLPGERAAALEESNVAAAAPQDESLVLTVPEPLVALEHPSINSVVVHLSKPVLIASSSSRSHESRAHDSNWRAHWGAWHSSLTKIAQPFNDGATSAIELGINTF